MKRTLLALLICSTAMATETKESMLSVTATPDAPCPEITGTYICGESGAQEEVEFKLFTSNGRQHFVQRTKPSAKTANDNKALEILIEKVVKFSGGLIVDGKVQEIRIPFTSITLAKYAMSCRENKLSAHILGGENSYAVKLQIEKVDDKTLRSTGSRLENGKVLSGPAETCTKK